jgi:HEAT repeat protein
MIPPASFRWVKTINRKRLDPGMDPITLGLVSAGTLVSVFLYNRWRLQYWLDIAASFDLDVVEVSSFWAVRLKLKARAGPLEVRIAGSIHNKGGTQVVVVIPGPPGFNGLRLRSEHVKPPGAREIEVGDKSFDGTFFVEGPMRLVFTLLDEEARRLLISANDAGARHAKPLEIVGGELRLETVEKQLSTGLPILLDIGHRFALPVDVAWRLAENATVDPEAGVRLMNLLLLVREFPGEPETLDVLRSACSDPSLEIRLRAAKELGAEGRGVLVELAENPLDDDLSARAVSILGRELPFERAKAILDNSLRRRRLQTARACLEALGGSGDAAALDVLAKVMAREQSELATVAAQALGTAGGSAAEGPLILALQREQAGLRVAAANALGRVGSPPAVLPLKEAAERFPRDPELSRATRQAIAEIQSRLPGASPGQLSLAGAEAGQLSLAQANTGQLSLAQADEGQLSLSDISDGGTPKDV